MTVIMGGLHSVRALASSISMAGSPGGNRRERVRRVPRRGPLQPTLGPLCRVQGSAREQAFLAGQDPFLAEALARRISEGDGAVPSAAELRQHVNTRCVIAGRPHCIISICLPRAS